VKAEEAVSTAELDDINSVYAYNVAKLSLARLPGRPPSTEFLKMPQ
jgi:hypothetical protein